jgi:hypothetical protein
MARAAPALRETEVTVAFVNPPRGDAKTGSIKAKDGTSYRVKPELLDVFQVGGVYEIEYETREYPPGNVQNYLETARDANGVAVTPERRPIPAPASTQKAYAKMLNGGANPEISAVGILKSFIEAGKVELNVSAISKAFKTCKAGLLDEFGDEVPY